MQGSFIHRPVCELCGSDRTRIVLSRPFNDELLWGFLRQRYGDGLDRELFAGVPYEIAGCRACGFLWQKHVLNDALTAKLYGEWVPRTSSLEKRSRAEVALYAQYARQVETIAHLLDARPAEIEVLDFGMGWGYWCRMARAFGYQVVGVELSKERVAFAREMGIEAVESLSELGDRQFDFVNAEQVFEHVRDPLRMLRAVTRHLRRGGVTRISVPNSAKVERRARRGRWGPGHNATIPLQHVNCFTHRTLVRLGREAGLAPLGAAAPLAHQVPEHGGGAALAKSALRACWRACRQQWFGTTVYFRSL